MRAISNNIFRSILLISLLFVVTLPADAKKGNPQPKYVFYMIGDGMGINEVYGTEIYNQATKQGPEQINFFHFPVRTFVNTQSATSLVTDSAAAGTALATGKKTYNDGMGVDTEGVEVSSITEWAKASGFGTGVATSVGVNHATPAAFYSHTKSRSDYETIARQLFESKVDFAAGAGFLDEQRKTGHDSQFLEQEARGAGFTILRGSEEFKKAATVQNRLLCLSAQNANELTYKVDRKQGETILAEFVQAGIDFLYGKYARKGFFFMVEGGKIDYAGHNDDGVTVFQEVNDFADAIDVVLAFYNQHPDETLIVVTSDHETGALMLGTGIYEMSPEKLAYQHDSENTLTAKYREAFSPKRPQAQPGQGQFGQRGAQGQRPQGQPGQGQRPQGQPGQGQRPQGQPGQFGPRGAQAQQAEPFTPPTWEQVKEFFKENTGLWGEVPVDAKAEAALKATFDASFRPGGESDNVVSLYAVNTRLVSEALDYLNSIAGYSWAHGAHSGSPVGLYVIGPSATEFNACQDNTDIPVKIAEIAGYTE